MASFTTWTVLPHEPLAKLTENLWHLEGTMPGGSKRAMAIVRLRDGRLIMHNAIAMEEELMRELDAFGEMAAILVPNAYHRQDARIMKDRYPKARVYAPSGARKGIEKQVPVDGTYAEAPGDDSISVRHLEGFSGEGLLTVTSADGVSAVFCDTVLNTPEQAKFPFNVLLAPLGRAAVPRATRWFFVKDKAALKGDLERVAETDGLRRIIVGHGKPVEGDAKAALRTAAGDLA